jgi:hypothetical protein
LPHNEKRIAAWYTPDMEVQINVAQGLGYLADGQKPGVYAGGGNSYQWYNFRIPKNANATPIDNDLELRYPLERHVEAIGLTGWDWKNRRSVRVGFDFDAITGHAKGVGISDEALEEIRERLSDVPEALLLRSTGGLGLHLYLEFDPADLPATSNHTEHAALALACLKALSKMMNFDFQAGLDVGGGNMWIWHKKMTPENMGLTILKDNRNPDGTVAYMKVPDNWELYIDVATRKRTKVRLEGVPEGEQETVADKAASQKVVPLDDVHRQIIADLQSDFSNYTTIWLPDHNLMQTHTHALKLYFEQRQASGTPLQGMFDTLSVGRDASKPNCFCFPQANGGFRVVRFGKGATEHESWQTDPGGWAHTHFNVPVDFFRASTSYAGVEDDKARFHFANPLAAVSAVRAMGHTIDLPTELGNRPVTLKPHKGGKMIVEVESYKTDTFESLDGWLKKKGQWSRIYNIDTTQNIQGDDNFEEIDNLVRVLVTSNQTIAGWRIKHNNGAWITAAKDDGRSVLKANNLGKEAESILGQVLLQGWTQVNLPFREEYPGDRMWNLNAAQLAYKPAAEIDFEGPSRHPSWDLIFNHIGQELDEYLVELPWAQRNNILTGRDYLLLWVACMLREPFEPLPYLYLYGPQNSGKSILHEAVSILMTKGSMRADTALTNQNDFNGELAGAILCVIEEKNITKSGAAAYNKIKDWVTSPTISIHAKHVQVYQQRNTTHWIQTANDKNSCPIFPGDTRITMICVPPLQPGAEVPKQTFLANLADEAPYFLATLLHLSLPDLEHRLRLPIVSTSNKNQLEDANQTVLETFLTEMCYSVPGACMLFKEFYAAFQATLSGADERSEWSKSKVRSMLPSGYPVSYYTDNKNFIGNITMTRDTMANDFTFISIGNRLVKKAK